LEGKLRLQIGVVKKSIFNVFLFFIFLSLIATADGSDLSLSPALEGKKLMISVNKGNCIACHQIPSAKDVMSIADIGPPLTNLKLRFPNRDTLMELIWDPTKGNINTIMPPFGKHKILSEDEISLIVDYLHTL